MTDSAEESNQESVETTEEAVGSSEKNWGKWIAVAALICIIAGYLISTQITIFVVQPIGAVPDGKTLIISRMNTLNFIDSADSWCERQRGKVSLFCRGAVLGRIGNNATVYLRLPYSGAQPRGYNCSISQSYNSF